MNLALGEVAALLAAPCGEPQRVVGGYSIDSRSIQPGQLFFALRGPRFDGSQFVGEALERGAVGAVVDQTFFRQAALGIRSILLPVSSTIQGLQLLAREVRRRWGRQLIAVTGSTGKSTTKEMIAALLAPRFHVLKSPGNLNNDYGLPLSLLALEPRHEVAVMELAMSAPGEIARLAQIAEPDVGVITNVAPVHLQFFDSLDGIARAKRELMEYLHSRGQSGVAVLNYDDERVRSFAEGFPGRIVSFGFEQGSSFRAVQVREGETSAFRILGPGWEAEFHLPIPGRHNVFNALAAIAATSLFDIPVDDLRQTISGFQSLHQRGEILTLPGGVTVINDSYNSNPLAMERMLETLAAWPHARRRIVVAGEMLELGPTAPALHKEIGRKCAASKVSWLIAVRGDAQFFVEGAAEGGLPRDQLRFFPDTRQAGEFCQTLLESGDVVLVKGSRAVRLETVIELLACLPAAAASTARRDCDSRP